MKRRGFLKSLGMLLGIGVASKVTRLRAGLLGGSAEEHRESYSRLPWSPVTEDSIEEFNETVRLQATAHKHGFCSVGPDHCHAMEAEAESVC